MKKKIGNVKLSLNKKILSPLLAERSQQVFGGGSRVPTCNGAATCIVTQCGPGPSAGCQTRFDASVCICATTPDQVC